MNLIKKYGKLSKLFLLLFFSILILVISVFISLDVIYKITGIFSHIALIVIALVSVVFSNEYVRKRVLGYIGIKFFLKFKYNYEEQLKPCCNILYFCFSLENPFHLKTNIIGDACNENKKAFPIFKIKTKYLHPDSETLYRQEIIREYYDRLSFLEDMRCYCFCHYDYFNDLRDSRQQNIKEGIEFFDLAVSFTEQQCEKFLNSKRIFIQNIYGHKKEVFSGKNLEIIKEKVRKYHQEGLQKKDLIKQLEREGKEFEKINKSKKI